MLPRRSSTWDKIRPRRGSRYKVKRVHRSWTGAEITILRDLYPHASWPELCAALPRHPQASIAKYANGLGLSRDKAKAKSPYFIVQELRRLRRAQKLDQIILADKLGTHRIQIAKWERGECVPRLRMFFDWVQALGYELKLSAKAE